MTRRITEYAPIPDEEVNALWEEIKQKHTKHLKDKGVLLPRHKSAQMYWLVYLWKYKGCLVAKSVIEEFVKDKIPNVGNDQQVRHLSQQRGFAVLGWREVYNDEPIPSGYYILCNLEEASHKWQENRRQEILSASDWESIKKAFDYCCATCGTREGTTHRATGKIVSLQKGHMDPMKPLEVGNIIPQCNYCNGEYYKNDFAFNEFGFPKNIHNPKYVLRSPEETQLQMRDLLNRKYNTDKDTFDNSED